MSNVWDSRYASEDFYYGTEPNDFLKFAANQIPVGGNVLCLAEGEGRNAVFLAKLGFTVTAVDGSKTGLEKLLRLAAKNNVIIKTVHADLSDFVIERGYWDAIVSIWCHLPEGLRKKIHKASFSGLKEGGVFILEAYHPRQLNYKTGGPPTADLMMTADILKSDLEGLKFDVIRELDREIHEGLGHNGQSAVVQVLARN